MAFLKKFKARSLGFESLENREMLSVSPLSFAYAASSVVQTEATPIPKPEVVEADTTASSIKLSWKISDLTNMRSTDAIKVEKLSVDSSGNAVLDKDGNQVWTQVGSDLYYTPANADVYTYEIKNLTASTQYTFRVSFGSLTQGRAATEAVEATTKSVELKAEGLTSTSIKLSWEVLARSSTYFQVQQWNGSTFVTVNPSTSIKADSTLAKSYTVTGLTTGQEYRFQVQYYDTNNVLRTTQEVVGKTLYALNAEATDSADTVLVSWNSAMGGNTGSHEIQMFQSSSAPTSTSIWSTATTEKVSNTEYKVTGLKGQTPYYFRVKYTVNDENGKPVTTYSDVTAFSTPTSITVDSVTATSIKVSWTFSGSSGYSYYVQYSSDKTNWSDWPGGTTTAKSYTMTDLDPGKTYYVRVRYTAVKGTETYTAYTAYSEATTGVETTLKSVTEKSATISWDTAIGTNFNVQRCDGSLKPTVSTNWTTIKKNVAGGEFTNNNIGSNQQYYYRVEYTDGSGNTQHTIYVTAVTNAVIKAVSSELDTVRLEWDFDPTKTPTVQMYQGESAPSEASWANASVSFLKSDWSTGCIVTGLIPGKTYYFRVLYDTKETPDQQTSTTTKIATQVGKMITTSVTSTSMELRWAKTAFTQDTEGRNYTIWKFEKSERTGAQTWVEVATNLSSSANTHTITGLIGDTNYDIRICITGAGYSNPLAELTDVRTEPYAVTINSLGKNSAQLIWTFDTYKDKATNKTEAGDGEGHYVVQKFVGTGEPTEADRLRGLTESGYWVTIGEPIRANKYYTIPDLATGSTQYYRVAYTYETGVAENLAGTEWTVPLVTKFSEVVKVQTLNDVKLESANVNSLTISWNPPAKSGTTYTLEKRVKGTTTWSTVLSGTTSTSTTVTGLAANTEYEFQVTYTDNSTGNSKTTPILEAETTTYEMSVISKQIISDVTMGTDKASATVTMRYLTGIESDFKLYYRPKSDAEWTTSLPYVVGAAADGTVTFELSDLVPETEYELKVVYVSNASGSTVSQDSHVKTVTISDDLNPSDVTSSSVTISWDPSSFADKATSAQYYVEWRLAGSTDAWSTSAALGTSAKSYTVSSKLDPNKTYEFRVKYATAANATAYSTVKTVTTGQPTITATSTQYGKVRVAWTVATVGNYVIQYKADDGKWYAATTVSTTASRYVDITTLAAGPDAGSLKSETEYTFRVQYGVKSGEYVYSDEKTVSTLRGFHIADGSITAKSVTFNWDLPTDSGTTYLFRYQEAGTGNWTEVSLAIGTTSYTATPLKPGVDYEFQLVYFSGDKQTETRYVKTPVSVPDAPSNIAVSDIKLNSAKISWTDNSEFEDGYVIEVTNTSTGATEKIVRPPVNGTGLTEYVLTDLNAKTTYSIKIYATGSEGNSAAATLAKNFTTLDVSRPNAVTTLKAATTPTSITLTWAIKTVTDIADPTQFRIEYYDTTTKLWYEVATVTEKTYTITSSFKYGDSADQTTVKLTAKTACKFRVIAISPSTSSTTYGESTAVEVTATPPSPVAPSALSAKNITISTAEIKFTDSDKTVSAADKKYTIEYKEGKTTTWPEDGAGVKTIEISGTTLSAVLTDLKAGTVYTYVVKSVYGEGETESSAMSRIATFTTAKLPTVSSGKAGFTLTTGNKFSCMVSWKPPKLTTVGDVAITYKIFASTTGKAGTFIELSTLDQASLASGTKTATLLFTELLTKLGYADGAKPTSVSFQIGAVFGDGLGTSLSSATRLTMPKFV